MARLSTGLRSIAHKENPPLFLAPILAYTSKAANQQSHFSTTAQCYGGRKRDGNRYRGVSALRRTGLRYPVSMSKEPLPQPVLDPRKRSKITIDKNHGLWGFFNQDRTSLSTPLQDDAFGKPLVCFAGQLEANQIMSRATVGCRRVTAQVLGGFTFTLVGLCKGAKPTSNRKS